MNNDLIWMICIGLTNKFPLVGVKGRTPARIILACNTKLRIKIRVKKGAEHGNMLSTRVPCLTGL